MSRDLRSFIAELDRAGLLRRIDASVDPAWEPGSLVKWMFQALPDHERFAFLFENVQGSTIPLLTAAIGASTKTFAMALGCGVDDINDTIVAALGHPIAPRTVTDAACQDVVKLGADASMAELPIPTWTPGKDGGPYLTTMVVTKNESTGVQNTGIYRTMVTEPHRVLLNLSPNRQGARNAKTFHDAGKVAPVAWVIGAPPAVYIAAVSNLTYGQDEMEMAGALQGEPLALVRCKTQDLLVPADAEIIIEGEIAIGDLGTEGPFGEFAGYMNHAMQRPYVRITAITHRRDPIFYGLSSQMPPSESTVMQSLANGGVLVHQLHAAGEAGVVDAFIDPTFGGILAHGIVAMKTDRAGHGMDVGRKIAEMTGLKRVTVVDADIDIRDPLHMDWAMNARYNPATDTAIINDVFFFMDPSLPRAESRSRPMGSKIVIDATAKHDSGTFSLPPRDTMMRALDVWKKLGLPEFPVPKRAQNRIDNS